MDAMTAIRAEYGGRFAHVFKTITTDNGSEFESFSQVEQWGSHVYYAHPHSPWERPVNERHNGLLRRYIPKGMSMERFQPEQVLAFADKLAICVFPYLESQHWVYRL